MTHPANLAMALRNVARNKGAPGVDGQSVDEVVDKARYLLPRLRRALLDGTYRPGDIRRVWIPKPGGGQRGLGIPNVIDRWVQQAMLQMLEPIFEPVFHKSSHGFRPNHGAHTAIAEAKTYVEEGRSWLVDIDLSNFFDRVNHQRLLDRLAQQVKDRRVLTLIKRMLKAQVVLPDGMRVSTEEGTPQGGPLSPLLSNVVLDEFDWELERRGLRFVRYADDCNIYVGSERAGQRVMSSVRRFLEGRLRLLVNEDKSAVARPENRHFLGFRLCRKPDGRVEVHLSQRTVDRLKLRIRALTPRSWGRPLKACFEGSNEYLRGWFAYFRICTQEGADLFRVFDAHIRRRVRAIIIHQKKRNRFLLRALVARGVSRRAATGTAWSRRGIWHRSNRPGMTRAYPNAWFRARLFSLADAWLRLHAVQLVSGQLSLFDHEELVPKSRM
jgi:group II intron reverse transcriptase/maturase